MAVAEILGRMWQVSREEGSLCGFLLQCSGWLLHNSASLDVKAGSSVYY